MRIRYAIAWAEIETKFTKTVSYFVIFLEFKLCHCYFQARM